MASKRKTGSPGSRLKKIDGIHRRLNQALSAIGDKAHEKRIRGILHELAETHLQLYGGAAGDVARWDEG